MRKGVLNLPKSATLSALAFFSILSVCRLAPAATVTVLWTAPGDDGNVGTATEYDMRYAADSAAIVAWAGATQIAGEPAPRIAGTAESHTFPMPGGIWFLALKTRDEAFNWSDLSNVLRVTVDETKPAAVVDFRRGP